MRRVDGSNQFKGHTCLEHVWMGEAVSQRQEVSTAQGASLYSRTVLPQVAHTQVTSLFPSPHTPHFPITTP